MAHFRKPVVSVAHMRSYIDSNTAQPFLRRLVTRMIGLVPSMVVAIAVGRTGINTLLVASQVALSVVLPFVAFPLIWLTSSKSIMSVRVPHKSDTFSNTTHVHTTMTLDTPPSVVVTQDESSVICESVRNISQMVGIIVTCTDMIDGVGTRSRKTALTGEG